MFFVDLENFLDARTFSAPKSSDGFRCEELFSWCAIWGFYIGIQENKKKSKICLRRLKTKKRKQKKLVKKHKMFDKLSFIRKKVVKIFLLSRSRLVFRHMCLQRKLFSITQSPIKHTTETWFMYQRLTFKYLKILIKSLAQTTQRFNRSLKLINLNSYVN